MSAAPGSFSQNFGKSGVQPPALSSHLEAASAASAAAPFLFADFSEDEMKSLEAQEKSGRWTGERLAQREPRLYAVITRMLGAEIALETIALLTGVSENSVRVIRDREPSAIEGFKKRMLGKMQAAQERLLDRVIEAAPGMKPEGAAVAFGIISDKLAMATGAPTMRVEITGTRSADEYREFMDSLTLDGCVTVEPRVTGLQAGAPAQRAASLDPSPTLAAPSESASTDSQSLDCLGKSAIPTVEATTSGPAESPETGGGGGHPESTGGG